MLAKEYRKLVKTPIYNKLFVGHIEGSVFYSMIRPVRLAVTSLLLLLWPTLCVCQSQVRSVLCRGGEGNFDGEFRTGLKVHIGAARSNGPITLAVRACRQAHVE
jgi:hypothetical protein